MRYTQITTGTLIGAAALSLGVGSAAAQTDEALVLVDVVVVNDSGGTLDPTTVEFDHPDLAGGRTTGTDGNPDFTCLTSDSGECYIQSIPTGPGDLGVPPVDGYTVTVDCTVEQVPLLVSADTPPADPETPETPEDAETPEAPVEEAVSVLEAQRSLSTASGATWDADPLAEIFCVVTLDDIEPSTTVPPTTAPPTTAAPTTTPDTTPPVTEAPTTPAPAPEPTTVLPATGPSDNGVLAMVALLLIGAGSGIVRLARR